MTATRRRKLRDSTSCSRFKGVQHINLSLANRQHACRVDLPLFRRIVRTLLGELLQIQHAELGICLVAAPEMTRLNETFLRHAGPTDVITFDYSIPGAPPESTRSGRGRGCSGRAYANTVSALHGEIFVCMDEAVRQARRYRTTWQSELVRYVIHALLHLRGFDDVHPALCRKMKHEESRLLRQLQARFQLSGLARRPSPPTALP